MLTLAHVSDIHIGGSPGSAERTRAVMRRLADMPGPLDAVIVTGDIADHGEAGEYETARGLLDSGLPTIVCPGNHDDRQVFRKVLLGEGGGGDGPVDQVLRLDGLTIALCDSSIPGRPEGFLEDETLAWLDAVLAESPDTPAVVGMHHPAAPLGIPYVDTIGLREPERLAEVLSRHPRVVAVLAGHAHTPASTRFAGLPLLVAPGVINTALIPAETTGRIPVDPGMPPQFALHVLDSDHLVTHVRPVV
ncbi:phosphodiesterase [Planomonospora venezuelensis]|uniref:3',5'-cyclic AMP phosphodiesterase CpdA n=1 Tax=Planomonospora venezuelensis TaxID=1999 RepID=A0A841DFE7_PLAVE|nr:phosphodiesterase [Planomonospora venezuelensis]MBB5966805.1 3',5'-cyclic AMP phosphodiesterase CpdA [Planomonospora venezuelensis]GIN01691.1 3',5'-cyclic adenosine monophosphate phosphodiesterase CpdA [Planomonospora venezuelensis]